MTSVIENRSFDIINSDRTRALRRSSHRASSVKGLQFTRRSYEERERERAKRGVAMVTPLFVSSSYPPVKSVSFETGETRDFEFPDRRFR